MYPSKKPRARALLSDEELEVADLLFELPAIILEIKRRRRLPESICWGVRKSRTLPPDDRNHHHPGRQPPVVVEEKKPETCPAAATTTSPSSPLSFPGSAAEDNTNNNDAAAAAVRPKVPALKNMKERNEWIGEQRRVISSLTESNANLHREIGKYRVLVQGLTAEHCQLSLHERMMPAAEAPADSPDSANAVDSSQSRGDECLKTQLPDLNEPAAEATEEEWRRQQDMGTTYAEARKRAKMQLEEQVQRGSSSPSGRRPSDPSISQRPR